MLRRVLSLLCLDAEILPEGGGPAAFAGKGVSKPPRYSRTMRALFWTVLRDLLVARLVVTFSFA